MLDFTGKAALVSGAGSSGPGWGNGRAIAVLLARQGAQVFAMDRDLAAANETRSVIITGTDIVVDVGITAATR